MDIDIKLLMGKDKVGLMLENLFNSLDDDELASFRNRLSSILEIKHKAERKEMAEKAILKYGEPNQDEILMAFQGKESSAIKVYKDRTGMSVKDAFNTFQYFAHHR